MENSENGGQTATKSASQAEQQIPKSRLDEVLADRNRLREQVNFSQQTVQNLTHMLQQQRTPRAPAQENPVLKKMREEGRTEEAALFQQLLRENAQSRQTHAALIEEADRNSFLVKYGKKAQVKLQDVERVIEAEKQRGNFNATREGAFLWLLGNEQLQKEAQGESRAAPEAPHLQAAKRALEDDGPSSDPNKVTTLRQTGASGTADDKNREAEIPEDFEF